MSNNLLLQRTFRDANEEPVQYDGSEITWRVSAYALVFQDQDLLVIKHKQEKLFDVVGGGMELGETIEQTLAREAKEEAGATIHVGPLVHAITDWFYHRHGKFYQTILLFYQAELDGELSKPTDKNIEWRGFMPLEKLRKEFKLPNYVLSAVDKLQHQKNAQSLADQHNHQETELMDGLKLEGVI